MTVTTENLHEVYNDPKLNIYLNGEIMEGYSEDEISDIINETSTTVEYFESTLPTVRDIVVENIRVFVNENWDPHFYRRHIEEAGINVAELSLLGDLDMKAMVDGILFNLTIINGFTPLQATEWLKRTSIKMLDIIHLTPPTEPIKKDSTDEEIEKVVYDLNRDMVKAINRYNLKGTTLADTFAKELCEHKPVNQCGLVLNELVDTLWQPYVVYSKKNRTHLVTYTIGNFIDEFVFIMGITNKEATARFTAANEACNKALGDFDPQKEFTKLMIQSNYTMAEPMLLKQFLNKVKFYEENCQSGKSLKEIFVSELKTPSVTE